MSVPATLGECNNKGTFTSISSKHIAEYQKFAEMSREDVCNLKENVLNASVLIFRNKCLTQYYYEEDAKYIRNTST